MLFNKGYGIALRLRDEQKSIFIQIWLLVRIASISMDYYYIIQRKMYLAEWIAEIDKQRENV